MNKKQLLENWSAYKEQIEKLAVVDKQEDNATQNARVKRALSDFQYFCEYYFSHLCTDEDTGNIVKNGYFHNKAAKHIKDNRRLVALFEWARGHAKSTHMGLLIPLWLKAQSYTFNNALKPRLIQIKPQFNNVVLVGKSEESAIALLGNLQAELQYNERYIHDFGIQFSIGSWESGNFQTRDNVSFRALGRGQSPRGLNFKGKRPDYIVVDDIDDDELCRNAARVDELFKWLTRALFNTMDMGRGRFIVVGNRISKNSIVAKSSEIDGIYHTKVNALTDKGVPTWSEKYRMEELNFVKSKIGHIAWEQEYMNNPMVVGAVFTECHFKPTLRWDKYAHIVTYTDPSFKNSATSDYKATITAGITTNGEYHILKAFIDKVPITTMIDWHYEIERIKPERTVIKYYMEANFAQDILLEQFYKEGDRRGIHIPISKDDRKKPDKYQRIENLEPLFSNGRLFFSEQERNSQGMKTLVDQFLVFQKGSRINDDGPDAVEGAVWKLQKRGHSEQKPIVIQRDAFRKNRM